LKRLRQAVLYILYVACVGAVGLVLAEWSLRACSPRFFANRADQFQYDPELGVIARPRVSLTAVTDHLIEVRTNDIGTRNYLDKRELLGFEKLVFCVGDSFTEGLGNLTDQSYPFDLDLLLNIRGQRYEKRYAVLNLGLGAYGSLQANLLARRFETVMGKKPDAILYLISGNDWQDDELFAAGYRHRHVVRGSPHYPAWVVWANERFESFQVYFRAKLLLGPILRRRGTATLNAATACHPQNRAEQLAGLLQLARYAREQQIHLFISYAEPRCPEYDQLRTFARDQGLIFVDYRARLTSVAAAIPRLPRDHAHSGGHFRSWVNLVIAQAFAAAIEPVETN
jgi:hypothetical protein